MAFKACFSSLGYGGLLFEGDERHAPTLRSLLDNRTDARFRKCQAPVCGSELDEMA